METTNVPRGLIIEPIVPEDLYGRIQRFFHRPLIAEQALPKSVLFKADNLGPFHNTVRLAFVGNIYTAAPITRLFSPGGPLAVLFAVVPVILLSLNRRIQTSMLILMLKKRWVHISYKIPKGLPFAFYSASAVSVVPRVFRVIAHTGNSSPRVHQFMSFHIPLIIRCTP